ncbi:MAG: conserved phage C-terminal domain-containing protein [Lachnospiraceae bacterium]|nr:conserved phage C-terminal domain-containing protein [Lachnospiraceae bacterium]
MNNAALSIYESLSAENKELLHDIRNLSLKKGYCWASNEYLAKCHGVVTRTIQRRLKKLKRLGCIIVNFIRGEKVQRRTVLTPEFELLVSSGVSRGVAWSTPHNKSTAVPKKEADISNNKELKYNKNINTSVFPTEKHNTCAHTRTSERENYIAKKIDDKKRTPNGVLKVVEKSELSLKYNSTLAAQGARIHNTKGYIFNAPKSIDAGRVSKDTLSTVENIIKALNQEALRHYKPNAKQTLGIIIPLLELGYKFTDFVKVINTKCKEWLGTPFAKYLRPKTLFRADNFVKYSNQHDQKSCVDLSCNQKVMQAPRKNKFANFAQREWDFAKIEYLNVLDDDERYTEEGMAEYRKYFEAEEKRDAERPRPTKFHNCAQREWDFSLIEKLAYED